MEITESDWSLSEIFKVAVKYICSTVLRDALIVITIWFLTAKVMKTLSVGKWTGPLFIMGTLSKGKLNNVAFKNSFYLKCEIATMEKFGLKQGFEKYRVYQNDWSVWKLIIFTSMVKRLINTSRNERVTQQVYDTCLQMCDFFGLRRKDSLTRSMLSSDTRGRPALFPLQRHPVVWNCWYQRLTLLGDGGSL